MLLPPPAIYRAGPVEIRVESDDDALMSVATNALALFSTRWDVHSRDVVVQLRRKAPARPAAIGTFLLCGRMNVDRYDDGFVATARSGMVAIGRTDVPPHRWIVDVPPTLEMDEPAAGDIEDMLSLALTVAWRDAGWQAVHAGAVTNGSRTLLLCAPSGGGKSTLTAALVRAGWHSVGDDKLLLRVRDRRPFVASLMRTFNLHPQTSRWFSELQALETLPRYSAWTPKRRLDIADVRSWQFAAEAPLTDLVRIVRTSAHAQARMSPLERAQTIPALLRQIVVPTDAQAGAQLLRVCALASRVMRAHELEIGEDAYAHTDVAGVVGEYFA